MVKYQSSVPYHLEDLIYSLPFYLPSRVYSLLSSSGASTSSFRLHAWQRLKQNYQVSKTGYSYQREHVMRAKMDYPCTAKSFEPNV
jgi:hypothetical protein